MNHGSLAMMVNMDMVHFCGCSSICRELYSRSLLDAYISRALGVPLKDGRLSPIDEKHYVLTLDYSLKMINIHEHHECGISVVIEGETGVGKTALVEMLSQLWNSAWHDQWTRLKGTIIDMIRRVLGGMNAIRNAVLVSTNTFLFSFRSILGLIRWF